MERTADSSVNPLLDSISLPLALCGHDFRLVYCNHALVDIFGPGEDRELYSYLSIGRPGRRNFPLLEAESDGELRFSWLSGPGKGAYEIRQKIINDGKGGSAVLIEFKERIDSREMDRTHSVNRSNLSRKIRHEEDMLFLAGNEIKKRDMGIRKRDRQINHQEKILEYIFTNTHLLMAFLDPELTILRANRALGDAAGTGSAEIEGRPFFEVFSDVQLEHEFHRALDTGEAVVEHNRKWLSHEESGVHNKYWDWSLQPVVENGNETVGLILIMIDVTRRIESEKQLVNARKKLDDAKRLSDIGTLAATVAHELRNPLGAMAAAIFNISRKNRDKRIDSHIDNIDKKIRESQQTINNLLNYARIKEPVFKDIHIYHLIEECIEDSQKRFRTSRARIVHDYEDFRDLTISVDPFQIREVITNVLNNALQAVGESEEGEITVAGHVKSDEIELSVEDNGPGIKSEDREEIFRPFFTVKPKGTGLGLTICRDVIHMHKGAIYAGSRPGGGTKMVIRLPRGEGS